VTRPQPETFGDIEDTAKPLAVLVHGFPDSPYTWRHLGPHLAERGYRVVAPWLPGYDAPVDKNVSLGTYMRHVLDVRRKHKGDDRAILIGHDWGAHTGYAVVAADPGAFRRYVAMAVPPVAALGTGMFTYRQLKRSFYIWFIQQVGLAETVFLEPGFLESLWGLVARLRPVRRRRRAAKACDGQQHRQCDLSLSRVVQPAVRGPRCAA
jgi:pimeloyl-ACP methyl ester carboxylesterase